MFVPEALKYSDVTVFLIFLANFKVFAGEKVLTAPSHCVLRMLNGPLVRGMAIPPSCFFFLPKYLPHAIII